VKDQDNPLEVTLINLTEICLVITITYSLKWTLYTFQKYQITHSNLKETSIEHEKSLRVISVGDETNSFIDREKGVRDNGIPEPIPYAHQSLLNEIERISQNKGI